MHLRHPRRSDGSVEAARGAGPKNSMGCCKIRGGVKLSRWLRVVAGNVSCASRAPVISYLLTIAAAHGFPGKTAASLRASVNF